MKRTLGWAPVLVLIACAICWAEDLQTGKVVSVKAYDQGRIAFWEGRVPIYDGYPFFDITLALGQKQYVVRYESMTGYYPSAWKAGRDVKVRVQGRGKMYIVNGLEEVLTQIFNLRAQDCVPHNDRSISLNAGPQVPCE